MTGHPRRRWPKRTVVATVVAGAAYALVYRLGETAGATQDELHRTLPGDVVVTKPRVVTTHARTIYAPPEQIWPWLVQMGWHRGGWYTPRWVDRLLFPGNRPSADRILPDEQHLAVGDRIPDGPPGTAWFEVASIEPNRSLVLHSQTHVPPTWRDNPRIRARIDWSWDFELTPIGVHRTRLVFRSRANARPGWVAAGYRLLLVPADYVMARGMLAGIADRVEHERPIPTRIPSQLSA